MSVVNAGLMLSAPSGYTIDRSLRFRSSASAYLSRTPASAGNRQKFTISAWVKRGALGAQQSLFHGYIPSGFNGTYIWFLSNDTFQFYDLASSDQMDLTTSAVFRDTSAWYHIVVSCDTTQATASNRAAIYVNGVLQNLGTATYPPQNYQFGVNNTTAQYLGANTTDNTGFRNYFDGYLTEVNFIDGQALTPSDFGNYNEDTGVWQPAKYIGTYGTNGFYLPFSDNSTTTTLGYDTSGNGNNWTANNISLTSGVTYDSMTDVPTLTSEDAANYATWNPLDKDNGISSVTEGNLKVVTNGSNGSIKSTIAFPSGKWYWEVTSDSVNSGGTQVIGIMPQSQPPTNNMSDSGKLGYALDVSFTDRKFDNGVATSYGSYTQGNGVVYMLAFDQDAGKLWYGVNGTWLASGAPATGSNPSSSSISTSTAYCAAVSDNTISGTFTANFGQRPFAYTPPAGFKSLNTYNLPDSTIEDGGEYFNAVTYTGTGASASFTGVGFQPDWVWIKSRSAAQTHGLFDSNRGVQKLLQSNSTAAEITSSAYLTAFDSDGFSIGSGTQFLNGSGDTFVAWNWKANGAGVSNTDGSITSTVSANTTAGFSIVSWTNQGTNTDTVGHGLGVAPKIYISKKASTTGDWFVFYSFVDGSHDYLLLNSTQAAINHSIALPTSTVFTTGAGNTDRYITYCFAEVPGYSKFGSYTGNGSSDGPFVYLGFRPAFVMVKRTDSAGNWTTYDDERLGYNVDNEQLYPNLSNAEGTSTHLDLLSNGFKWRTSDTSRNASGGTYIYACFSENPFKNALAR